MKFNKVVCVDNTKLKDWSLKELQNLSEKELSNYKDYPESKEDILKRIGDAEAIFVSWHTEIGKEVNERCPNLKYIGMCCSLYDDESANVAFDFARKWGIVVKGIRDYGDPGVVEFIVSELVRLLHGFGNLQWKEMPMELTNRKIGIIGLGTTGQLLAQCLLPFGVNLFYYSRTRKTEWEEKGVKYLSLKKLLETAEIISLHLPKKTRLLTEKEFEIYGSGKVLINTSLGLPFEEEAFEKWIANMSNYAILDGDGKKELKAEVEGRSNIVTVDKSAGWSAETHERLSKKVIENVKEHLFS